MASSGHGIEATRGWHGRRLWLAGLALALVAGLGAVLAGVVDPAAAWVRLMAWIVATQRELHQALATALRAVQAGGEGGGRAATLWLATLGFLYGVFHAAGPGHGKVVITTYLATQRETLWRGIALAVASSLVQGLVAIVAVFATMTLFAQTARQSQWLADRLELASFGLVAALGLFLVWRHGRALFRPAKPAACGGCGGHHHHHHHAPPPTQAFAAGILSIGLRPCSGAILVLVLAIALELPLAGIAAVVAMSLGTALTVSGLAALAVFAREQAGRLAARLDVDGARVGRVVDGLAVAGGLLLLAMGLALLQAGLVAPAHPLMRG